MFHYSRGITRVQDQDDFAGSLTDGYFLKYDSGSGKFTLAAVSVPAGADPTGTIGLSAVNGSASTFLRSDGAPALDQAIAPTWTGSHIWNVDGSAASPVLSVGTNASTRAGLFKMGQYGMGISGGGTVLAYFDGNNGGLMLGRFGLYFNSGGTLSNPANAAIYSLTAGIITFNTGYNAAGQAALVCGAPTSSTVGLTVKGAASQSAVLLQLQGQSSTTAGREQADIDAVWQDSTDATRKARLVLRAWDTSAREGMRIQSDGTYALTSIGGGAVTAGSLLSIMAQTATHVPLTIQGTTSQTGVLLQLTGETSLYTRAQADIDTVWIDSTDATRKSRLLLRAYDTMNREVARGWADGSAGRFAAAAPASAPTDANIGTSQVTFHIDESGHNLTFRVCYSDGSTYKSGTVALT